MSTVKGAVQTFTYTAQKSGCYGFVGALSFVFLLEAAVWAVGVALLVRDLALKLSLIGLLVLLILAMVFGHMLAPLWTKHRLTPGHLHLRYGWDKMIIPRTALVAARPVRERVPHSYLSRAEYEESKARIFVAFSEFGQVLLRLDKPHQFRVNRSNVSTDSILLNVDSREEFLAALGLPETPQATANDPLRRTSGSDERRAAIVEQRTSSKRRGTSASSHSAICTENLSRRYGDMVAVNRLSLDIRPTEIYGFLGPNGAGKTTTLKMLVGLVAPSSGSVIIAGHDMRTESVAAKSAFGYVPDQAILYDRLTGREFLQFLAQMRRIPKARSDERIDYLLNLLELLERADSPCGSYSFGMKRKLALAGALIHEPSVLILDEPLNGLDPRSARALKDLLIEVADSGAGVMLSTHDLATAEQMCHRIGIIHRGQLIAEGTPEELRSTARAVDLETVFLSLIRDEEAVG